MSMVDGPGTAGQAAPSNTASTIYAAKIMLPNSMSFIILTAVCLPLFQLSGPTWNSHETSWDNPTQGLGVEPQQPIYVAFFTPTAAPQFAAPAAAPPSPPWLACR